MRRKLCFVLIATFALVGNVWAAVNASQGREPLADVTIRSTLTEITDYRPGYLYLLVQNQSDSTLVVDSVTVAEYPTFLKIKPAYYRAAFLNASVPVLRYPGMTSIPKGSTGIYGVFVETRDQVVPGKHLLVFNVQYSGYHAGRKVVGSVPVSHEVKSSAYGENEILGALQNAVTFLMLPGIIVVIVVGISFYFFFPEIYKEKFPEWMKGEKLLDPRLWVVAIMVSLLFVWKIYPFFTKFILGSERSYLRGYGFIDIFLMWGFSVLTGVIIFSLWWLWSILFAYVQKLKKERRYQQREYRDDESPETFLEKITRAGLGNGAWYEVVTMTSTGKKGFLIEKDRADILELKIMPPIELIWQSGADNFPDDFDKCIGDRNTSLQRIMTLIQEGRDAASGEKGLQKMNWKQATGYIEKPYSVKKSDIGSRGKPESPFYSTVAE